MIFKSKLDKLNFQDDIRFSRAVKLFNSQKWYEAHDLFEEIWHETIGPDRKIIQAILQIAVAQLHLDRGNVKGATILYGEALGRLKDSSLKFQGLNLQNLVITVNIILDKLQTNMPNKSLIVPSINLE